MDRQLALTQAYGRYHQAIYRYCLAIVGNPDDAQEALQNTMVKALRALPGEEREIQIKPWLYRIAHNESIELLRRRRELGEIDAETASTGVGLAETAAQRERLRRLLADLGELPERQRAALVMRELGGLRFEEIGQAFDTSKAVARQTVYEARLALRELEAGREMNCEEVMHRLSNADGRTLRRRDLRAHLRACPDCRAFREAIDERRRDLAALAPLPAAASAATLHAVLGGGQGGAGASVAGSVGAGAGKAIATSAVAKSVATVAAVAALGVGVADREGLVDLGLRGGAERPVELRAGKGTAAAGVGSAAWLDPGGPATSAGGGGESPNGSPVAATEGADDTATTEPPSPAAAPASGELPAASDRGQETAAAQGGGRAAAHTHSKGHASQPEGAKAPPSPPKGAKPDNPGKPAKPSSPEPPAKAPDSPPAEGKGPDKPAAPPSQPPEGSPDRGGPSDKAPGGGPKEGSP